MTEKEFYTWLNVDINTILLSQKESHHNATGDYKRTWVIEKQGVKHKIVEVKIGDTLNFNLG